MKRSDQITAPTPERGSQQRGSTASVSFFIQPKRLVSRGSVDRTPEWGTDTSRLGSALFQARDPRTKREPHDGGGLSRSYLRIEQKQASAGMSQATLRAESPSPKKAEANINPAGAGNTSSTFLLKGQNFDFTPCDPNDCIA
jgi:hypothetical protein